MFSKHGFIPACVYYSYCLGSLDVNNRDWHATGLGAILSNCTIIKSK
jgi:hypothetical protein